MDISSWAVCIEWIVSYRLKKLIKLYLINLFLDIIFIGLGVVDSL